MSKQFRKVYFVRTDGSDANDGLRDSSAHAFLTIQRAVDAIFAVTSVPTAPVTIRIAHGAYSGAIKIAGPVPARPDGYGFSVCLMGDESEPQNVRLEATSANLLNISDGASVLIAGMTLQTHESGNLLTATRRATIGHRHCILGPAATETISASRYGEVYAMGPTTVSGSSPIFAHATTRSTISFTRETLTFAEGIHFSRYLWGINDSTVRLDKCRIIGRATGEIGVHINGILNVSSTQGEWRGGSEPRVLEGGRVTVGRSQAGAALES